MRRLTRSSIGYVGKDGVKPFGWNPGGHGCSGGCDGCWAKLGPGCRLSKCPDCKAFKVHLHEERLCEPANTKTPGVVLCNFTNDWLDPQRTVVDVAAIVGGMRDAAHHTYVTLTKNAKSLARLRRSCPAYDNEYDGLTIRNQADADEKLPDFLSIPGKLWLSLEPLWGPVGWYEHVLCDECRGDGWPGPGAVPDMLSNAAGGRPWMECCSSKISGIIIGHDNRRHAPGTDTIEHALTCAKQCKAAGVPCYVKQLWIDGKLRHEPEDFPEDLRLRELPWATPEGEKT